MNKSVLIIVIILLIIAGGFFFFSVSDRSQEEEIPKKVEDIKDEKTPFVVVGEVITYTNDGYTPSLLTVKVGDTVIFVNESDEEMWTASAIHPTHRVYPGTDIAECNSTTSSVMFDACVGIPPGESWEFIFNEVGDWKYHNHVKAGHTGEIVVEESETEEPEEPKG